MKKFLSILLAVCLLALCLAGCGASSSGSQAAGGSSAAAGGDATGAGIPADQIKVGVIHIGDPADGSGYSYAHDQGIVGMQQALGLSDDQIIRKNNVADDDAAAIQTALEELVEAGCNIIFATSWGYMDYCEAMAQEYGCEDVLALVREAIGK